MHKITFVSTVHKEIGKCNADELCKILHTKNPDVIFLEALEETYTNYQHLTFSSFGVFHEKLEIKAIQKYNSICSFEYIPVLEKGLSYSFDKWFNLVCENTQFQKMIDNINSQASVNGFDFLNSLESITLHTEMREYGYMILDGKKLNEKFNNDIEKYENSMLRSIYRYSKKTQFENAIFMCGVAHRQSIINKIKKFKRTESIDLDWKIYGK